MKFHPQALFGHARSFVHLMGVSLFVMASLASSQSYAADPLKTAALKISNPESSALFVIDSVGSKLMSAGERGHVILSDDQGKTWRQQDLPVSVTLTDVQFFDDQIGWLTGHDGVVLKSENGGESWKLVLDGFQLNKLVADHLAQIERSLQVQLAKSEDKDDIADVGFLLGEIQYALRDTQQALENRWTRPLFTIAVLDEKTVLVGGAYGTLIKTVDGGLTWQAMMADTHNPRGLHFYDFDISGEAIYLTGEYGLLRRSLDGGATWDVLESPYEGTFFGVRATQEKIIVYGLQGTAYIADGSAGNWRLLELPTSAGIVDMVHLSNENMVFLASDGGLFLTDAQGKQVERLETKVEGAAALYRSKSALWLAGLNGLHSLELFGLNFL